MADLDDFFAKKDRKKSKTNKKFATTEEVAKKLEEGGKKVEKPKKERQPPAPGAAVTPEGEENTTETHEQDEWKEFEEEKKDYTGLKIGNLTLNAENENATGAQDGNYEQQQTFDDDGKESERKNTGPWKKMELEAPAAAVLPPPKEEKKIEVNTPNVVGGAYVPPSMRNQVQQPQQPLQPTRLRAKVAPDIHNEDYFPTLSSTKEGGRKKNEGSFEVVSHNKSNSLKYVEQTKNSGQPAKLSLGNRYNTLSNDS